MDTEVFEHRISLQVPWSSLVLGGSLFGHSDETLFRMLWNTSCWCLLFIYRILWVILTPFLLCFVYFQLTDFFHHLLLRVLQGLQHLNEDVGIVSMDSWLWLGFNPVLLTFSVWLGCCW